MNPGDLLVFNDSKVFPARLFGTKKGGGAKIEILLLEERVPAVWEVLAQRAVRLSIGTEIELSEKGSCQVLEVLGEGRFVLEFQVEETWESFLEKRGPNYSGS